MMSPLSTKAVKMAGAAIFSYSAAVAENAYAQTAAVEGDIVVTAQRREQNLQDVGVSVTALSSDSLREQAITSSTDISKIAPSVQIASAAGGANVATLSIRGVSQSDFSSNQESPNSIYVDEVYLASSNEAAFTFYDLERLEVLRGPQGTLFGRSSSGGLASFISKRPTDSFEGYADVGYGSFNSAHLEAAISGPLSNAVRARLSGRSSRADGWFRNANPGGKAIYEDRFWGLRGQVEADLTPDLTALVMVSFDKTPRNRQGGYKATNFYIDGSGQPAPLPADLDAYGTGPGKDLFGYRDPFSDAHRANFNNVGYLNNQRLMSTLYLNYKRDNYTISSISNFTEFKSAYNEDCDGGPVDGCQFPSSNYLRQFSQELKINGRVSGLTYTAGTYYLNISQRNSTNLLFPSFAGTDRAFNAVNPVRQKLESYSLFGQLEYAFSQQLSASFGVRWTHDDKKLDSKTLFLELGDGTGSSTIYSPPLVGYDFSSATVGSLARARADLWSGKFQLDYKPMDDVLLYASASRGAKGPGFNTNLGGGLSATQTPFKSENLWAYETGFKTRLLDRRLTLNGSIYYYDYNDFQAFAFTGLQSLVGNYNARFYGGELEISARLPADFRARLGVAYLNSTVFDVRTQYNGVQDQESILAPNWTLGGSIDKDLYVGLGKVGLSWSFDYGSDRYASVDNNPATKVEGSFVHNARISYSFPSNNVEISAFVNNISNIDRENFIFDFILSTGSILKSYSKPRWFGIAVRTEF